MNFGLRELVDLLWFQNFSKDGMAILRKEYDRKVWKKINVRLQTKQPTSGGAATTVTNCSANCVESSRHQ